MAYKRYTTKYKDLFYFHFIYYLNPNCIQCFAKTTELALLFQYYCIGDCILTASTQIGFLQSILYEGWYSEVYKLIFYFEKIFKTIEM